MGHTKPCAERKQLLRTFVSPFWVQRGCSWKVWQTKIMQDSKERYINNTEASAPSLSSLNNVFSIHNHTPSAPMLNETPTQDDYIQATSAVEEVNREIKVAKQNEEASSAAVAVKSSMSWSNQSIPTNIVDPLPTTAVYALPCSAEDSSSYVFAEAVIEQVAQVTNAEVFQPPVQAIGARAGAVKEMSFLAEASLAGSLDTPPGSRWIQRRVESSGRKYWQNSVTGVKTFEKPSII